MYTNADKQKLKQIQIRDTQSFDLFYDLYYDQVFRFAYFFLKDVEACKDIISEIFLSVWKSRDKLSDIENIEAWLYVITKNEAIRYQHNLYKRQETFTTPRLIELEEPGDRTPEELLLDKEIEELLNQAIDTLPEKCRIIFLMIRYEGRSTAEVSEILSIKESTVRVQMKIATEKIVEKIKYHYPHLSFSFFFLFLY